VLPGRVLAGGGAHALAAAAVLELSRSAVWFSRDSSVGEKNVAALQSSPLKIRG
jgi:hypothetical protein